MILAFLLVVILVAGFLFLKNLNTIDQAGYFWDAVKLLIAYFVCSKSLEALIAIVLVHYRGGI